MARLDRAIYRLLLRLYPAEFRREHARELEEIYVHCTEVERGRRGAVLARVTGLADAVQGAIALRGRVPSRGRRTRLADLVQDARYALRAFTRAPLLFAGLVLVLALGIGANGAIFSLVQAVLLEPLPYRQPDRVAMVWLSDMRNPGVKRYGSTRAWLDGLRDRASDTLEVAAMKLWLGNLDSQMDLVLEDRAERLRGAFVTPNFFRVIGVEARLGRVFGEGDQTADVTPIVVSDAFWRRALGSDRSVVGRTVTLVSGSRNRAPRPMTIVGVLAPDVRFTYPAETEVWALEPWSEVAREPAGAILFHLVARLEQGVDVARAEARIAPVYAALFPERAAAQPALFRLQPISDWVAADSRPALLLLSGVAMLLLVIACATVANALLVRLGERQRELAVRASLGAGRRRLVRQLLTEGVVLSLTGTAAGSLLAIALLPIFRSLVPPMVPRADEMAMNLWMLAFAAAVALVVTTLAALTPALVASRFDLISTIKRASNSASQTRGGAGWRSALVGVQAAVAACLLVGAALLLLSFWHLSQVDLGYDADDVITLEMRLLDMKYRDSAALARFQDDLVERVRAIPGVADVGLTTAVPFRGVDFYGSFEPRGCERAHPAAPTPPGCEGRSIGAQNRTVDAGYFSVMQIGLTRGRSFLPTDTPESPRVAIVSEAFARQMYGDVDPLGQEFFDNSLVRIVGVVDDLHYDRLDAESVPAAYFPRSQRPAGLICVVVRAAPGAAIGASALHGAVRAVDPAVPAMNISTIGQIRSESIADRRFYTTTTIAFASLALLLTAAGLVIVISRSIVERRKEIAIRTALGARSGQLVALLTRQGLRPVLIGLGAGLGAAWLGARILEQFLFQIDTHAPAVYVGVAVAVVMVALTACLWPATRLGDVTPAGVLRND